MDMFDPVLYGMLAASHMWLLRIWNGAGTTKELTFKFNFN